MWDSPSLHWARSRKYFLRACLSGGVLLLALVHAGCNGCSTPSNSVTSGSGPGQSETAVAARDGGSVITITYNDDSNNDGKIVYTSSNRTVYSGATLLGWSYSTNNGATWNYGGHVATTSDWPVIWGDPAIAISQTNTNDVFLSNLAVPASKYPASGLVSTLYTSDFYTAIGGACIARSTDAGKSFNLYQCIHSDAYDFYDGGSMASSPKGDIYAGFVNVDTSQIDIWRSPNETGSFSLMPTPFGSYFIATHPRLRVGQDGSLYVAAQDSSGQVLVNRYVGGAWGTPKQACANVPIYPTIYLSDRKLRTAVQFSFDVGADSIIGNDAVRFVCTTTDNKTGRLYLESSFCPLDLSTGCQDAPGWSTSTANSSGYKGDQFNPIVKAFQPSKSSNASAEFKVSFLSRENDPSGNTVSVQQGNLAVLPGKVRVFVEFDQVPGQVVCPDNRGYWGDYDDMQIYQVSSYPSFIRGLTDSTAGCTQRWDVEAEQVHVNSSAIN